MSGGGADKSQQKRVELWTKEVLEYMQSLLDELCQHEETQISAGGRDSGTILPTNSSSQKLNNLSHGSIDEEEPPLVKRWHYMYHVLQLHMSEGLLHRAEVIDWVLKQLQVCGNIHENSKTDQFDIKSIFYFFVGKRGIGCC